MPELIVMTPEERALDRRIRAEGLHHKRNDQLAEMRVSHADKRVRIADVADKMSRRPGAFILPYEEDGMSAAEAEAAAAADLGMMQWKSGRLADIVKLLDVEIGLRDATKVARSPIGTRYYADSDNGNDSTNDGTTATKSNGDGPWASWKQFATNARSAGDVLTCRGGMTAGYEVAPAANLNFTSDGTMIAPLTIEADYDDAWGDHVDLSGTATATLEFGNKEIVFSADVSGVLAAGQVIFVASENPRRWAYEVASVAGATVTLHLPYKGAQAGSGKTMTNMGTMPVWQSDGTTIVSLGGDDYWALQGVQIDGQGAQQCVVMTSLALHGAFRDCAFVQAGGNDDRGLDIRVNSQCLVRKSRFYQCDPGVRFASRSAKAMRVYDCLFDGNSGGFASGAQAILGTVGEYHECEFVGHGSFDVTASSLEGQGLLRNCTYASTTKIQTGGTFPETFGAIEDYDGTPGDSRIIRVTDTPIMQSETTTVRTGGSAKSRKVMPDANLTTTWDYGLLRVLELPLNVDTTSRTYDVYFSPDDPADWDATPSATELWIELEAWGGNNHRQITKSTGTVDMTNVDAVAGVWEQKLSVTVAPAQSGVAYLRVWYARPPEAGNANIFYVDPLVVIDGRVLTQDVNGVQGVFGEFVPVVTDRSVYKPWS